MPNSFTTYWDSSTWKQNLEGKQGPHDLGHTASNAFKSRGVKVGDHLFVVNIRNGQLHVAGRMTVDLLVSATEARRVLNTRNLYKAKDHAICKSNRLPRLQDCIVPMSIVRRLRFITAGGDTRVRLTEDARVHPQAMRAIRMLTPESAQLLEKILQKRSVVTAAPNPNTLKRNWKDYFIESKARVSDRRRKKEKRQFVARLIDWQQKSDQAGKLGKQGEQFVFEIEKKKVRASMKPELANEVKWVARDEGDGAGYDIESFDTEGAKIVIEVKTTRGDENQPFFVTQSEIDRSVQEGNKYRLYRVINFDRGEGEIIERKGPLPNWCQFEPLMYSVQLR